MKHVKITSLRYGLCAFTQEHLDIADDLCNQAERDLARKVAEALEREVERLMFGDLPPATFLVFPGPCRMPLSVSPPRVSFGVVRTDIS